MVWVGGHLIIPGMTGIAIRWGARIDFGMAFITFCYFVCAIKFKTCGMKVGGFLPAGSLNQMTFLTLGSKHGCLVVRVVGNEIILQMATITCYW